MYLLVADAGRGFRDGLAGTGGLARARDAIRAVGATLERDVGPGTIWRVTIRCGAQAGAA